MKVVHLFSSAVLAMGVMAAGAAQAVGVSAVSIEADFGAVVAPGPFPGRDDPNAVLGAPDDAFYSLGLGGVAVLDFGALLSGRLSAMETTFVCEGAGAVCDNHVESVEVLVSDSYTLGSFDLSGFTSLGELGNRDAQASASLDAFDFQYVAFVDTTPMSSQSFDGFDLESVMLAPIPVPPAALSMIGALAGLMLLQRRRAV